MVLTRLGEIGVRRFMREYWQRRPVLIRAALPDFAPPVDRKRMFELAASADVESRLIVRDGARWSLRHGPIPRRSLPPLAQPRWTLLVQGLDQADASAHELLARFRFVPDARLDDLMASFATDGGGVPAHVDNYDVFLLQAYGRRRWRISRQHDQRLQPGMPLKLLADFRPTREWVLEPGDMLYLPPGVAHEGVAVGACVSYSIGFRTPTWQELHDPWLARFAEGTRLDGRYADPGQRVTAHPGELPNAMISRTHAALSRIRPTRAHTARFLLEHLSEPKPEVVFRRPQHQPSPGVFARAVRRQGVILDARSRMLYGNPGVALNGELFEVAAGLRPALHALADRRRLDGDSIARAPAALVPLLREWLLAGWLHFDREKAP